MNILSPRADTDVRVMIKETPIRDKARDDVVIGLRTRLEAYVNNETALNVLDVNMSEVFNALDNVISGEYEANTGYIIYRKAGKPDVCNIECWGRVIEFTESFKTVGETLAAIEFSNDELTDNVPELLETLDNLLVTHSRVQDTSRSRIITVYRIMRENATVPTSVTTRLFTDLSYLTMVMEANDIKKFTSISGIIITNQDNRKLTVTCTDKMFLIANDETTIAKALTDYSPNISGIDVNLIISVCVAIDELLSVYDII